jgi:hypothetical protein
MNYLILNYSEIRLLNFAIIFGKNNLKLEDKNKDFNVYTYYHNDSKIFIPILNNNSMFRFKLGTEKILLNQFEYLKSAEKIIVLPDTANTEIVKTFADNKLLHIVFQGDPFLPVYDESVKVICSTKYFIQSNIISDIKLCLPFFFYKHQISLVDFNELSNCENTNPLDKVFVYGRRSDENINLVLRHRGYFIKKIKEWLGEDKIETANLLHNDIELESISTGRYHLGNFFDYQKCMFNVVFESQHVDYCNEAQNWISEKTLFALLFANPPFLLVNRDILNVLKELGIKLLNDDFEDADIGISFDKFCKFLKESSIGDRIELFKKHKLIQIENRKKLLDYIYSAKEDVINFIIS